MKKSVRTNQEQNNSKPLDSARLLIMNARLKAKIQERDQAIEYLEKCIQDNMSKISSGFTTIQQYENLVQLQSTFINQRAVAFRILHKKKNNMPMVEAQGN